MKMKKQRDDSKERRVYVITGGPCTGKTTILKGLEKKGFRVQHEIARAIIEEQQSTGGKVLPWIDLRKFQQLLLKRQLEAEKGFPEGITFTDRGLADSLAYTEVFGMHELEGLEELSKPPRYHKIIIPDILRIYENDDVRKEDQNTAIKVHQAIEKTYRRLGYEIIKVPPLPPAERLEWLIRKLGIGRSD